MIASATRLQLRSPRFLVPFLIQVWRVRSQARKSTGCLGIELRKTRGFAFWTKTLWKDKDALNSFNRKGSHETGKPKLRTWCDEAVHAHWDWDKEGIPSWEEAEKGLVQYGRLSQLDHPSPNQRKGVINIT